MEDKIKAKLQKGLPLLQHLIVKNNSYLHAAHEGYSPNSHFYITIVTPEFTNLTSLDRHKLVYSILNLEFREIHSISLNLMTPQEFAKKLEV